MITQATLLQPLGPLFLFQTGGSTLSRHQQPVGDCSYRAFPARVPALTPSAASHLSWWAVLPLLPYSPGRPLICRPTPGTVRLLQDLALTGKARALWLTRRLNVPPLMRKAPPAAALKTSLHRRVIQRILLAHGAKRPAGLVSPVRGRILLAVSVNNVC